ncbi:hypothetical protein MMC13_007768 [Lambiella insularis]|nr:hypothetical protein [Lambiella insularis]
MVYSLTYSRPAYTGSSRSSRLSFNGSEKSLGESVSSTSTAVTAGIPEALSFDRVISGGTCPPCTIRDFMNYLVYIERSAENLQFFLWYRDYCQRFSQLSASERALAREWTPEKSAEAEGHVSLPAAGTKPMSREAAAVFKGTDFAQEHNTVLDFNPSFNPFHTPPQTPDSRSMMSSEPGWASDASTLHSPRRANFAQKAASAYEAADVKIQPCEQYLIVWLDRADAEIVTIQPFREEITRIIATYVSEEGSRQLNLAAKEKAGLLRALASTTHPSAFRDVAHTIEWSLRHQAHPNFIRWSICNGNPPRVTFARGLGVGGIVAGLITAILITLSGAGRGWRVLSAIGFMVGIATLIAAWKGMCVVLHGLHHRHLRPWELFAEEDDASSTYELKKSSMESFGSSNSYEDEPWVVKYENRNIIRKILDREVWIQEPALRQIQDTIFLQAILGGLLGTAIFMAIFVPLPKGNML